MDHFPIHLTRNRSQRGDARTPWCRDPSPYQLPNSVIHYPAPFRLSSNPAKLLARSWNLSSHNYTDIQIHLIWRESVRYAWSSKIIQSHILWKGISEVARRRTEGDDRSWQGNICYHVTNRWWLFCCILKPRSCAVACRLQWRKPTGSLITGCRIAAYSCRIATAIKSSLSLYALNCLRPVKDWHFVLVDCFHLLISCFRISLSVLRHGLWS